MSPEAYRYIVSHIAVDSANRRIPNQLQTLEYFLKEWMNYPLAFRQHLSKHNASRRIVSQNRRFIEDFKILVNIQLIL